MHTRASEEIPVKRTTIGTAAFVVLVGMVSVGCSSKGKNGGAMATNPGVTDVSITPTPAPTPVEPVPPQPVVSDTPTQAPAAPAPVATTPAPSAGGAKYTVQKGDTLWKIATASYGDGKQWQRIASANPGVSPTTLKVGQTITIP